MAAVGEAGLCKKPLAGAGPPVGPERGGACRWGRTPPGGWRSRQSPRGPSAERGSAFSVAVSSCSSSSSLADSDSDGDTTGCHRTGTRNLQFVFRVMGKEGFE